MSTGFAVIENRTRQLVDSVASQLATVRHFDSFSYISTPLLIPGGGTVVVRVSQNIEGYLVTDHGFGAEEADLMGGKDYYSRIAQQVAQASNIGFDQHSFFILQVTESQLVGAVMAVANCTQEAVLKTFEKVQARKAKQQSDRVYRRLTTVFDKAAVSRDYMLTGASNHEWVFDSSVKMPDGRLVLFDAVSKHHGSVFSAVTKFHDIARNDNAPKRVAVIGKREEYGDYISLLSQASKVIEQEARNEIFLRAAAA